MAATSHPTLPSNTYNGLGSQGDIYHSTNHGIHDSGVGSLNLHPYQYQTNSYGSNITDNQPQSFNSNSDHSIQKSQSFLINKYAQQVTNNKQQRLNDYSNSQTHKTNDRQIASNNNTENYATTKTTQVPHKKNMDNQHIESKNNQQTSNAATTQHRPPAPVDNQHHQSQPNLTRSEQQISDRPPKQQEQQQQQQQHQKSESNLNRSDHQISKARATPPLVDRRSLPNGNKRHVSERIPKPNKPPEALKPTRSSTMRDVANKKNEEIREQKRKDRYFPSTLIKVTQTKLKSQDTSPETDVQQSDIGKIKQNQKQKNPHVNDEQRDIGKTNRNKKQFHSQPKQQQQHQHKSRPNGYQTEDNNSSGDDDKNNNNNKQRRNKSKKRTTFSDSHLERSSNSPPLRRSQRLLYYDPYIDYPLPPGHPLRRRYPYYEDFLSYGPYPDRYSHRHLYEDASDIPPYLAPYHDPYDPFFDYERRKTKSKQRKDKPDHEDNNGRMTGYETERDDGAKSRQSRKSTNKNSKNDQSGGKSHRDYEDSSRTHWERGHYPPPYYDGREMLELWRRERNDYLKKEFKPTVHDVLYSQQWMKTDSYLENQRRRALRDSQGYYFPYKKYTLKDYKELQRLNSQNPFADVDEINEITIDRKERAKKRQEYGTFVERQIIDNPRTRQVPPREMSPRKPWHFSNSDINDPDNPSKRERALEYAKAHVKYRPVNSIENYSHRSDPTEQYVNNLFPEMNDNGD